MSGRDDSRESREEDDRPRRPRRFTAERPTSVRRPEPTSELVERAERARSEGRISDATLEQQHNLHRYLPLEMAGNLAGMPRNMVGDFMLNYDPRRSVFSLRRGSAFPFRYAGTPRSLRMAEEEIMDIARADARR